MSPRVACLLFPKNSANLSGVWGADFRFGS